MFGTLASLLHKLNSFTPCNELRTPCNTMNYTLPYNELQWIRSRSIYQNCVNFNWWKDRTCSTRPGNVNPLIDPSSNALWRIFEHATSIFPSTVKLGSTNSYPGLLGIFSGRIPKRGFFCTSQRHFVWGRFVVPGCFIIDSRWRSRHNRFASRWCRSRSRRDP